MASKEHNNSIDQTECWELLFRVGGQFAGKSPKGKTLLDIELIFQC